MPNLIGSNGTILGGAGTVGQNFNQYGIVHQTLDVNLL